QANPAYGPPPLNRERLGVGHPGHKDAVPGYVLRDFPKADDEWLDDLLRGLSDGAADLAAGDGPRFLNAVALRLNPPRSSKTVAPSKSVETQPADAPPPDKRSPLQRLVDRFK
ncbi:MAG: aminoacyl-tRNA hydrolase, partial [Pseudomonadota bacterium]